MRERAWLKKLDRFGAKPNDVQKMELPFKHKSGHIIYVQMLACNVYFSGESYFMAVIRDITMRMKADKERQQQQDLSE